LVECMGRDRNVCVVSSACGLRRPLEDALNAFLGVLDRYTLGDLMQNQGRSNRMRRLLEVCAPVPL